MSIYEPNKSYFTKVNIYSFFLKRVCIIYVSHKLWQRDTNKQCEVTLIIILLKLLIYLNFGVFPQAILLMQESFGGFEQGQLETLRAIGLWSKAERQQRMK